MYHNHTSNNDHVRRFESRTSQAPQTYASLVYRIVVTLVLPVAFTPNTNKSNKQKQQTQKQSSTANIRIRACGSGRYSFVADPRAQTTVCTNLNKDVFSQHRCFDNRSVSVNKP